MGSAAPTPMLDPAGPSTARPVTDPRHRSLRSSPVSPHRTSSPSFPDDRRQVPATTEPAATPAIFNGRRIGISYHESPTSREPAVHNHGAPANAGQCRSVELGCRTARRPSNRISDRPMIRSDCLAPSASIPTCLMVMTLSESVLRPGRVPGRCNLLPVCRESCLFAWVRGAPPYRLSGSCIQQAARRSGITHEKLQGGVSDCRGGRATGFFVRPSSLAAWAAPRETVPPAVCRAPLGVVGFQGAEGEDRA